MKSNKEPSKELIIRKIVRRFDKLWWEKYEYDGDFMNKALREVLRKYL